MELQSLVWLWHNDPSMTPAEFIVRCARRFRWGPVRFNATDVDRASTAIERDPHYRRDVIADARTHIEHEGIGKRELAAAVKALP